MLALCFTVLGTLARRGRAGVRDRGASALEWAIIAAVVVVAASVVGAVVYNIVETKSTNLQTCANQPVNSKCTP